MEWKTIELYDGLLQMKLPVDINYISEKLCRVKFPYRKKPDYIGMNSQNNVFLTASRYPKELYKENIYYALLEMREYLSRLYPECISQDIIILKGINTETGWFSFHSNDINGEKVHFMAVSSLQNKFLLCSMHTEAAEKELWLDNLIEIVGSFCEREQDD